MEGLVDGFEAAGEVAETVALEIAGDVVGAVAGVVEEDEAGVEIAGNAVGAAVEVVEVVEVGIGVAVGAVEVVVVVCESAGALKQPPVLRPLWNRVGTEIQLALSGIGWEAAGQGESSPVVQKHLGVALAPERWERMMVSYVVGYDW